MKEQKQINRFVLCLVAILGTTSIPPSQSASGARDHEHKHLLVPMPKGSFSAEALDIVEDLNPPVVHLKGTATVRIETARKDPRGSIVLHADAVDLNQTTGEIIPSGKVRLTVEDIK